MTPLSQTVLSAVLPQGCPPVLGRAACRLLGFAEADRAYAVLRTEAGSQHLFQKLLEFMEVSYSATPAELKHIPRTGPAVIVANHPFGILEAVVLATAVRQIRPDVRILANEVLRRIPELSDLLIPVDVLGGSASASVAGMRRAVQFLNHGGLLIVFPAGAVSHFQWNQRASVDPPWNASVIRLIRIAAKSGRAPVVVPVFVPGSNSPAFHAAGMLHPSFRTALLARELFNKKRSHVELRVGHAIPFSKLAAMPSDTECIQYLRWRTYLLANRHSFKPNTKAFGKRQRTNVADIIAPIPVSTLATEVERLPQACLLDRPGDLCVYLAKAGQIPQLMREIGRLREITFRQAGEGTGRSLDLDKFDEEYQHLFVWNAAKAEVVGAYRLQTTENTSALYTRTLFQFDERFLNAMGPAVELGRSFIRAEYQKGFAPLLLLWKGIGKFIAANPRCKTLFGPVSISNQYQAVSRDLMIAYLEKCASVAGWMGLVRARNAPAKRRTADRCSDVEELSEVISDLEPTQTGIPVLLRQYLKLGGKLLSFNVDPEFSDVLDGLIVVDLTKTEPKLLERYLGRAEAGSFIAHHAH